MHSVRRKPRPVGVVLLVAALAAAADGAGGSGTARGSASDGQCDSARPLSPRQCRAALSIAHREAKRHVIAGGTAPDTSGWPASISTVAGSLRSGTVAQPNIGPACVSGWLLTVRLLGSFQSIAVAPPAVAAGEAGPPASSVVHGVSVDLDARTLRPCLLAVHTGVIRLPAHAVVLFRR
jgi:hypothetical protein